MTTEPTTDPLTDAEKAAAAALSWHLVNPVDVLYALRDQADRFIHALDERIVAMHDALAEAEGMRARLDQLADTAQDAAELVAASDLMPSHVADVPERSGLSRPTSEETER